MAEVKKFRPKDRQELRVMVNDPSVGLCDIDTSLITDMNWLFHNLDCPREDYSGIENWDTSNVTTMQVYVL